LLQDQLAEHSTLFGDRTKALFAEQQRAKGHPIPMTLGWHIGSMPLSGYLFKEGGGGGFHCMMRLYPTHRIGTVLMTNATGINVSAALDALDPLVSRSTVTGN